MKIETGKLYKIIFDNTGKDFINPKDCVKAFDGNLEAKFFYKKDFWEHLPQDDTKNIYEGEIVMALAEQSSALDGYRRVLCNNRILWIVKAHIKPLNFIKVPYLKSHTRWSGPK